MSYFRKLNKSWDINTSLYLGQSNFQNMVSATFQNGNDPIIEYSSQTQGPSQNIYGSLEFVKAFSKKSKLFVTNRMSSNQSDDEIKNVLTSENNSKDVYYYLQVLHSLKLKKINSLEYGVFFSRTNNDMDFRSLDGDRVLSSGMMTVGRNNYTAFVSMNKVFKNNLVLVLEGKLTKTDTDIIFADQTTRDNDFYNFRPQVTLSRRFKKAGKFSLFYKTGMNRPSSQNFNSFAVTRSPQDQTSGNGNLQNERSHYTSLSHNIDFGKKVNLNTRLSYMYINNNITHRTIVVNDIFTMQQSNIDYENIRANFNLMYRANKRITLRIMFTNIMHQYEDLGDNKFDQGITTIFRPSITYVSKSGWVLRGSGHYYPQMYMYQSKTERLMEVYLSINKTFWKKLNVTLSVQDLFDSRRFMSSTFDNLQYKRFSQSQYKRQNVSLSLRYNFGKQFYENRQIKGFKGD